MNISIQYQKLVTLLDSLEHVMGGMRRIKSAFTGLVWFGLGRYGDDRRHLNKLEVKLSELHVSSFLMNSHYSNVKPALH